MPIDLDDDTYEKLEDEVSSKSREFSKQTRTSNSKRPAKFGLCSTCNRFHYIKTLYDNESAVCSLYKTSVPSQDRIVECSDYFPFDQPDIYDLFRMATLIEAKKDRKIGF